jgi:RNA polymerase sigma-70 factor (ECF subfamily)
LPRKPAPDPAAIPPDEGALLAGLRSGDEASFEALVRAYGGRMRAAALRILRREEDADEAVQEAFLSAFRSLDGFQGEARLGTWLQRIAINAALMKLRARARRAEQELDPALLPGFSRRGAFLEHPRTWQEPADAPAARAELQELVRARIEELPENHRIALVLRDIEGLGNQELAERLGVSANAAKIRVHRARQALRALLDPHLAQP